MTKKQESILTTWIKEKIENNRAQIKSFMEYIKESPNSPSTKEAVKMLNYYEGQKDACATILIYMETLK